MAIHSKLTVVKLDTSGGVLTDVSTYFKKFSISRKLDLDDVTTFGASDKQWLTGFADADIDASGPWTRAADNFLAPIFTAFKTGSIASISFEYAPEGTSAGSVKQSGELIMTDYEPGSDVGGPVEFTCKFKVTGGITVGTY